MSTPATESKDTERPSHLLKTILTAASSATPVVVFIAAQPSDTVLKYAAYLVPLALVGVGFVLWYWKTDSTTTDQFNKPYRIRKFPKWTARAAWGSAAVTFLVFAVVWVWFRDDVLPVVTIDKFEGTHVVVSGAQSRLRMSGQFEGRQIAGQPPPLIEGDFIAYPAIVATLTRQGSGKVQIESVRLQVEEPDFGSIVELTASTVAPPTVQPNQYIVTIANGQPEAEAHLYQEGKPSTALPIMDDKDPIVRLHVGVEGAPGMYRVKLVVAVRDERGRKQTIKSDGQIVVNTSLKRRPVTRKELDWLDEIIENTKKDRKEKRTPEEQARWDQMIKDLEDERREKEKDFRETNPKG